MQSDGRQSNSPTSWGGVAGWYDDLVEADGSYQKEVMLPNLLRLVDPRPACKILDLACGQGFFSRAFAERGAEVTGVDISPELIELARKNSSGSLEKSLASRISYHVSSADSLPFLSDHRFDAVTIVLAIQNIERYAAVFTECFRVLNPNGCLLLVLNHPAFRIPGQSGWDFDKEKQIQYRRVDAYLGESSVEIDMQPGKPAGEKSAREKTISFHRPLQSYFKVLEKAGFTVKRLEEWTSHKKSEAGPRQAAENRARNEFPLFLMIEAVKK